MNAYELAKYIEDDIQIQEGIADMLRQQADRIAELEKLTREPTKVFAVPDLMAKAGFFKRGERVASQIQTKPLSDEEITDVFVTCLLPDGEFDEHEFARAIEERHGIK